MIARNLQWQTESHSSNTLFVNLPESYYHDRSRILRTPCTAWIKLIKSHAKLIHSRPLQRVFSFSVWKNAQDRTKTSTVPYSTYGGDGNRSRLSKPAALRYRHIIIKRGWSSSILISTAQLALVKSPFSGACQSKPGHGRATRGKKQRLPSPSYPTRKNLQTPEHGSTDKFHRFKMICLIMKGINLRSTLPWCEIQQSPCPCSTCLLFFLLSLLCSATNVSPP